MSRSKKGMVINGLDYTQLHRNALVADLHCDTAIPIRRGYDISQRHNSHHIDLPRLKEGGVNVQVFAASAYLVEQQAGSKNHVIRQIELLHNEIGKNPDSIAICRTSSDIERVVAEGKIAAILAIEGGLALGDDPRNAEYFYAKGIRIITIAHEAPAGWCANWKETDPGFNGLTETGREMIREMNRLGIIIDLSHSSDETVEVVLEIADAPVIASHSCARSLCRHRRNLTDNQIKAIAQSGGVIGVTFVNNFISEKYNAAYDEFWKTVSTEELKKLMVLYGSELPDEEYQKALKENFPFIINGEKKFQHLRVAVKDVVNHIDHMVNLAGADHVAIGSDFDGMSSTPIGLENCSKMPEITRELGRRNYNSIDIQKILGENFRRVFKDCCG